MPIPGKAEPRPLPGQQQQQSISFLSAIPIKKRRFPIICPPSPEENIPQANNLEHNPDEEKSKNNKESPIDPENRSASVNDASKTSDLVVGKDEATRSNLELEQANVETIVTGPPDVEPTVSLNLVSSLGNKAANVETIASGHPDVKPTVSLNPVSSLGNKAANVETIASGPQEVNSTVSLSSVSNFENKAANVETIASGPQEAETTVSLNSDSDFGKKTDNIPLEEQISSELEVLESCTTPQTSIVKQEIVCGSELSAGPMSVKLSLGLEEPIVLPSLELKKSIALPFTPEKSDPSQLSLALSEEKSVGFENSNCTTVGDVGTNRSNWDLNTTMEDWEEDSSKCDSSFAQTVAHVGGFVKIDGYHDEKSSLTTAENVGLGLNKGKKLISDDKSIPSKATAHIGPQCKIDDTLGLRLGMPHREHLSLSGSFFSTSATPNLSLQRVHMSTLNMNRSVKLEPADVSSRRDCSVGSSNSSSSCNMVLLGSGSVKTESVLKSPVSPDKLINHSMSVNPEVHQESCASSSSSSSLTVPLMSQNYLELSMHSRDLQLRPCKIDKHKLTSVDEAVADDDEKINLLADVNKELFDTDCGSHGNRALGKSLRIGETISGKEDADLEEGEVWEPVQHPAIEEGPIDMGKKTDNLEFSSYGFENLVGSGDRDFDGNYSIKENHDKSNSNKDSITSKPNNDNNNSNPLQKVSDTVLEVGVDENIFASVTPDKELHLLGRENIEETPGKEISRENPTDVDSEMTGFDVEAAATTDVNKAVQKISPGENISTWSNMVEASLSGHDEAKGSGNKSRIINLSRASVETSPCKTRSFPNRLMVQRSGKERYFDLDGEIQPRGNREENYSAHGSSNKFTKDRANSRPNFMYGRGRTSGRFGSLRGNEWDSDHNFVSETSYGTPNYRTFRRKHAPNVEIECNDYDIQQDSNNNRRKTTNDEFRRASIRRLSPGDNNNTKDRPLDRENNQTFWKFTRNRSLNDDKFMGHLPDDIMNPIYNHPQDIYDEFDGQLDRGNRNFSNMQRKGYPRIRPKSPVRSRTRSPGPWSSPRRRSPNRLQDLPQHRSPGFYRTGRTRSPERGCFRDEMVSRRRGSPYVARHPNNDIRDVDSGREHCRPRLLGNPRSSPSRVFQRNARRTDTLDSRELEDGDEYMSNEPLQSNKFHDENRKFAERRGRGRGPGRSFRPGYNGGNGENFRFHMNDDGSRPYRFCPDTDSDFVERGDSMRERECDGRIKHQPMGPSRRNRNDEDQQDGEYRPVERVWHDDEFGDNRGKRRRF